MPRTTRSVHAAIDQLKLRGPADAREVAAYIATLSTELVALTKVVDLKLLNYLLDMVRIEAEQQLIELNRDEK
ncbi:MAG: hypothetical protein WCH83_15120 [Alphaproteobacteria bacterium]